MGSPTRGLCNSNRQEKRGGVICTSVLICTRCLRRVLRNGGEYADLYLERSSPLAIQCEDDRIEKVIAGRECGAGLRLISGKRTAYAYTNELTTSSLLGLAEAMSRSVSGREGSGERTIVLHGTSPAGNGSFVKQPPGKVATDRKADMVKRANHVARNFDPRVRQVLVTYRENCQEVLIATSSGDVFEDTRSYLTAMVQVVASDGGTVQTGYESVGGLIGHGTLRCGTAGNSRREGRAQGIDDADRP